MKKQAKISRNPMIYNNPEFEKPMKMVDFCRSRGFQLTLKQKGHLVDALFNGVGSSLFPPAGSKWVAGGRLKRCFLLNN